MSKGSPDHKETTPSPEKETKPPTSWRRRLARGVIWFFAFLILSFLVLQIPSVQNYAAQKLIASISETLDAPVYLKKLRFPWFDKLKLEDLVLEDQQGDTLLVSGILRADLNLNPWVLYTRGIEVEAIRLENSELQINRQEGAEKSNLQTALDLLFPKNPNKEKNPLQLNLGAIGLRNISLIQRDSVRGEDLRVHLDALDSKLNLLDIPNKNLDIAYLEVDGPLITIDNFSRDSVVLDSLNQIKLDQLKNLVSDSTEFKMRITQFSLCDGRFVLHNYRKEPERLGPSDQINWRHLNVGNINIDIDSFNYARDTFNGRSVQLSLDEGAGFQLNLLSAQEAQVSSRGIILNKMRLETPQSILGDTLRLRYKRYQAFESFEDSVRLDIRLNNSRIALEDIITFAPKLNENPFFSNNRETALYADGKISRQINNLRVRNLNLRLEDGTYLIGDLGSRDLAKKGEAFLNLKLERLRTDMRTLRQLIPNFAPPANFDRLGSLDFSGRFDGFLVDFVADGALLTDLGSATLDMRMNLKPGVSRANYEGKLDLTDFDLAGWSQNEDFGRVNFSTQVENGIGLTAETAEAKLSAQIKSFSFRNYEYRNATIVGELNRNFFNGDFGIQDENIDLSFNGELDFRDSIPEFDFLAVVSKLDLQELNLSPADLEVSGNLDIKLANTKFSKMTGNVVVEDFSLIKDGEENYQIDSLYASSFFDARGEKIFKMRSDIGQADIRGAFDIDELPGSLKQFIVKNYPGFADRLNIKPPRRTLAGNQFVYDIQIDDSKGLNYLASPKLGNLNDVRLIGSYNGVTDSLALDLDVPKLNFSNVDIFGITLKMDGIENEGTVDMAVDSTVINQKTRYNQVVLYTILEGDTINFGVNYASDKPGLLDKLTLNGDFFLHDSTNYRIKLERSNLSILESPWTIDENNTITFGKDYLDIRDFALSNKTRRILLRKTGERSARLDLQRFNFDFIDEVWDYRELDFKGRFNASVSIEDVFKLEGITAAIEGDTMLINGDDFGRLRLDANLANLKSKLGAYMTLTKDSSQMVVEGNFNLADLEPPPKRGKLPLTKRKNYMAANISMAYYPLKMAEYWIGGSVSNVEGSFAADLQLTGMPNRPDVTGYINARNGALTIDFLKTRYYFDQGFVSANNFLFDASGTVIKDKYGNTANVSGGISHNHLKNLGLNATLRTDRFLALDTQKGDNELFYGHALGAGEIRFTGSFKQSNIYINATVGDDSNLTIPIDGQRSGSDGNLIDFVNRHQETKTTELVQEDEIRGLSLEMDLNITEEAVAELVFNEQVGDLIRGSGRGDIRILLPRNGDFQMYGQYIIEEGNYLFTLYNVVNKDFRIKRGGLVSWSGDPFGARIQLEAEYKDLKASVAPFIQEYLNGASNDLKAEASNTTEVDLTLKLRGELLSPDIDFDLAFPNLRGQLQSYAENKLRLTKQDQNELNRQVFGLVVVGQFLPSDLSISGVDVATNTVSELLSNQFSLLLTQLFSEVLGEDNVLSGVNFDLNYNQSQFSLNDGEVRGQEREIQLTLQKNFLNDRLNIQIGGNVDFGQAYQNAAPAGSGAFLGNDIVIEYILNNNRTLKLRVYQRSEPDIAGGRRNEVGTGISFRREFDSFKDFWKSLGKKDK